jgi:hypothetical protein
MAGRHLGVSATATTAAARSRRLADRYGPPRPAGRAVILVLVAIAGRRVFLTAAPATAAVGTPVAAAVAALPRAGAATRAGVPTRAGAATRAGVPTRAGAPTVAGVVPTRAGAATRAGAPTVAGVPTRAGAATRAGAPTVAGVPTRAGAATRAGVPTVAVVAIAVGAVFVVAAGLWVVDGIGTGLCPLAVSTGRRLFLVGIGVLPLNGTVADRIIGVLVAGVVTRDGISKGHRSAGTTR